MSLRASIDGPDASLSAYLVDYGEATRTGWTQDTGLRDLATSTCFGQGTEADTGCYLDVERRTRTRPFEVVARGWANVSFLTGADTFDPDESHRLTWEIMTDDYVFEAGHRIGIVLSGIGQGARAPNTASDITVHLNGSHVQLPIVGGPQTLRAATR